jgi:hypothetical protein
MGFWEPAKIDKDIQVDNDRRIIARLAKEKLESQAKKVNTRLENQREKLKSIDYSNSTKRAVTTARSNYDFTLKELDSIKRRIDICNELLS